MTGRDGRITRIENIFLRGGNIKFIVLPDIIKSSPALKKIQALRAKKVEADSTTTAAVGKKKQKLSK
jgi:small nuclear ribonucleoprotein D3